MPDLNSNEYTGKNLVLKDYNGRDLPTYQGVKRVGIPNPNGDLEIFLDTTDATATPDDMVTGATAYVQGRKITGTGRFGGKGTAYITIVGKDLDLSVDDPQWDGTVEYSYDGTTWEQWDGSVLRVAEVAYLRGSHNTVFTNGDASGKLWLTATSKIVILGNIENLLDYDTVSSGGHPVMGANAFQYMFAFNTRLAIPPDLGSTTLSNYCYAQMFYGCTSLLEAPKLSAITLGEYCYYQMFYGCTELLEAPLLQATVLKEGCYKEMFSHCTQLEALHTLPATTLEESCYEGMFQYCDSLRDIAKIEAINFAENSCKLMFAYCGSIGLSETQTGLYQKIYRVPFSGIGQPATNALLNMFLETGELGIDTPTMNTTYYWYSSMDEGYNFNYVEFSSALNDDISIQAYHTSLVKSWNGSFEIFDNSSKQWVVWNGNRISGKTIKIRGISNTHLTTSDSTKLFSFTGREIIAKGYIESLLDYQTTKDANLPSMDTYAFYRIFKNCTNLKQAPRFMYRSSGLTNYCYAEMYYGCSSLLEIPELPASTLAPYCYYHMFRSCTSLTSVPRLPATTLQDYCYGYMFYGCTSITQIADFRAMTTTSWSCSQMFYGCSSLVTAPALPATSLGTYCYYAMFSDCTSLINPPELPAMTVNSYSYEYMFQRCSSLITAPELPAMTLGNGCYYYMFSYCTALLNAPDLPATICKNSCYTGMFSNCTSLVNMPKMDAITLAQYCCSYMFNNCTSLTNLSDLSAPYLATYCYQYMFQNCTSLEQLPELPTISTYTQCYYYMFNNCTKIKVSGTYSEAEGYVTPYRLPPFGQGSSTASNAFTGMFLGTGGSFTSGPNINTTYYTSNTVIPCKTFTDIDVHLTSELTVPLHFSKPSSGNLLIDWGDGASTTISDSAVHDTEHIYANEGDYQIRIRPTATSSNTWTAGRAIENPSTIADQYPYGLFERTISTSSDISGKQQKPIPYVTNINLGYFISFGTESSYLHSQLNNLENLTGIIEVPSTITYVPSQVFGNLPKIQKIIFKYGVTKIGSYQFYNDYNLEEVIFPKTLTTLGAGTTLLWGSIADGNLFNGKNRLKNFIIQTNSSCTSYGLGTISSDLLQTVSISTLSGTTANGSFTDCSLLEEVNIRATYLPQFLNCPNIEEIYISDITSNIQRNGFNGCTSLKNFRADSNNSYFSTQNGVLFNKNQTILVRVPPALEQSSYNIPNGVTSINEYAFESTQITELIIPNNITTLGNNIFQNSKVQTVQIGTGITTNLTSHVFYGANYLINIIVSNSNTAYSSLDGILYDKAKTQLIKIPDSRTNYIMPDTVTSIYNTSSSTSKALVEITLGDNFTIPNLFQGNTPLLNNIYTKNTNQNYQSINGVVYNYNLDTLVIYPRYRNTLNVLSGITTIGPYAFYLSSIKNITLPNTLTAIGSKAFFSSDIENITLSNTLTSIGSDAFQDTKIAHLILPGSLTNISESAFYGCDSLTSIIVSEGITSLPTRCFSSYSSTLPVTYIKLPSTLTSMGEYLYSREYQRKVLVICYATTPPTIQSSTFSYTTGNIYVPSESVEDYKAATYWSSLADRIYPINYDYTFSSNNLIITDAPYIQHNEDIVTIH